MRVLALVPEAFGGRGGIARYCRDFLAALCTHAECTEVVALPRLVREPVRDLPSGLNWVSEAAAGRFRFAFQVIRSIIRGPRFDLILCMHINLLPLARFAQILNRAPVVLTIYGIDAWCPTGRLGVDRLAARPERVIAISRVTGDRFSSWSGVPKEKVCLIPNAVHLERFGLAPPRPDLLGRYGLSNSRVLLTIGRLWASQRHKGIDEVLELMPELVLAVPNLKYVVGGEGDDAPRLHQRALALGIADRVVFTGYIDEKEMPNHYRLADAFAMPGRGEGFGYVFLEAMACGIPVVASKLDGSREAVRNGQIGILVDPSDQDELKAGILQALERPREIPAGLEYFSYDRFESRVHEFLDSAEH